MRQLEDCKPDEEVKQLNLNESYIREDVEEDRLDRIMTALKDNPKLMPEIFFKMFEVESKKVINFLSNKSNLLEDISVILKMPKMIFIKALFK